MKTWARFLVLMVICLIGQIVLSQEGDSLEEKATNLTSNMQEKIGFSADVKSKVYDINLKFINDSHKLKSDETSKLEKFKSLRKLDNERDDSLKEIFTKEEFEAFQKFKEENRETMKEKFKEARMQKAN